MKNLVRIGSMYVGAQIVMQYLKVPDGVYLVTYALAGLCFILDAAIKDFKGS